ncbi:MAG: C_GCAxxG_C_C family protein [Clostridia bacterium]|nr:C_GCAxxG_C_C family protein [Clostridia bacterium]
MTHVEKAQALRDRTDAHFNCCQAVVLAYTDEAGLTKEQAGAMAAHFGAGMRMGSVCGAVTGGLMALGLLGKGEEAAGAFRRRFQEEARNLNCANLLRTAVERGEPRKEHCDRMVRLAAELVEEQL